MLQKPKKLYRGRTYYTEDVLSWGFTFEEKALIAPPAKINEKGEKTVGDGNEYGVYMSDNISVATEVYGNIHQLGRPITIGLTVGSYRMPIFTPRIGVVYEIDTNGLDVRKPKIIPALEYLYNNGYEGDEWIADIVPRENYKISQITIGEDYLHPKVTFPYKGKPTEQEVKEILIKRKDRLTSLNDALKTIDSRTRARFYIEERELFTYLYGEDGIMWKKVKNLHTADGCIDGLLRLFEYDENMKFDLKSCSYLYSLKKQYIKENAKNIGDLKKVVQDEVLKGKSDSERTAMKKEIVKQIGNIENRLKQNVRR